MKRLCLLILSVMTFSCYAAPVTELNATDCGMADLSSPNFCTQFQTAARCNCARHLGQAACNQISMPKLCRMMKDAAHTNNLAVACRFQQDISYDICVAHWTAYGSRCEPIG